MLGAQFQLDLEALVRYLLEALVRHYELCAHVRAGNVKRMNEKRMNRPATAGPARFGRMDERVRIGFGKTRSRTYFPDFQDKGPRETPMAHTQKLVNIV